MSFHKHGCFSFSIAVQKMSSIGGDSFVADVTSLRRHTHSGTATALELPIVVEQYGETAQDAQLKAIEAMRTWLDRHSQDLVSTLPADRPRVAAHSANSV